MNKKLKQILTQNSEALINSNKTFENLYSIMFSNDSVLAEDTDGFSIITHSYGEVREKIEEASCALFEKIGSNHEYIALEMENSIEWIIAFWAILRSGNKPFLVNCRHPESLLNSAIENLKIRYIIGKEKTSLNGEFIDVADLKTGKRFEGNFENEIALSTSATSLKEVICFYTGENLSEQILNVRSFIKKYPQITGQYNGRIKNLAFLPFYHVFGLIAVYFWFTFFGQTVVFLKNYSADTIIKTCKKHEVTHIFAVPVLWHNIENSVLKKLKEKGEKKERKFKKGMRLCTGIQNLFPNAGMKWSQKIMHEVTDELFGRSVRFCINGGSYVRQSALEMINGLGYNLHNGYGMTEIGITSVELRTKPKHKNLNSIGTPFASVEYRINPDSTLSVKGNSLCSKILSDGAQKNVDDWFNTGDIVEEKDGYYYISGRIGDMIIGENGENINPDSTESQFKIPEADNFCVVGLEHGSKKEVTMIVQINKYMSCTKRNMLIDKVISINDSLPVTSRVQKFYLTTDPITSPTAVKVSRKYLIRALENGDINLIDFKKTDIEPDAATYNDEILKKVTSIVAGVLAVTPEEIDIHAHIMLDLGADSMQYFDMLTKLAQEFDISSSGKEDLRYTVHEFCRYIERHL